MEERASCSFILKYCEFYLTVLFFKYILIVCFFCLKLYFVSIAAKREREREREFMYLSFFFFRGGQGRERSRSNLIYLFLNLFRCC